MFEQEKTIALSSPIVIGKGDAALTFSELKLREPTAGELEKASVYPTATGQNIHLIHLVAKVPRGVVEQLPQRDFQAAADFFVSFYSDGARTGGDGQS